ncbi:MAG TPA: YaeQ family protein [Thermoanaerobaculia bacterium]|nr:YaeQ family protein [Thermoanaerobaculia bacterium]
MALTATIYNFATQLADIDRGVYETLDLRMARQPSETGEYMLMRFFAYCLEYAEGIAFTEGVAAGDEPAVLVRDATGRVTGWFEVGAPDAGRLHRGSKLAGRTAVYTHRPIRQVLSGLTGQKIHRAAEIPIYAFEPAFVSELADAVERRTDIALSITERELYLDLNGRTYHTSVVEHRIPS